MTGPGTSRLEAIWVCGAEEAAQAQHARPVPAATWFPIPTTVIARTPEIAAWLTNKLASEFAGTVPGHVRIVVAQAQSEANAAVVAAIEGSSADWLHLRFASMTFDPLSLRLLEAHLNRVASDLVAFDVTLTQEPVHWLPATALVRHHGLLYLDQPSGRPHLCEAYCVRRRLLMRMLDDLAVLPPTGLWGRAIVQTLQRLSPVVAHVPLLVAAVRRDRIRHEADPDRSALALPFIEREYAPLLRTEAWVQPAGADLLAVFVKAVLGLELAASLSPSIGDLWRQRLGWRLDALWPTVRGLMVNQPGIDLILFADLAGALDLLVIDRLDVDITDAVALLTERLQEEALLGHDVVVSRVLSRVTEGATSLEITQLVQGGEPETTREARLLVHQARQLRHQARLWRAACAAQIDRVEVERRRFRELQANYRALARRTAAAGRKSAGSVDDKAAESDGSAAAQDGTPSPPRPERAETG